MLGSGASVDDQKAPAPAPPAGPQIEVSIFTPPKGTANDPGVMVIQKILMKVNMR